MSCKGKGSAGPQPSCDVGIFGGQAMQIGTSAPPTHLHPFPLKHEFNSLMVQIFFLYYYFMGKYPALYDLSATRIEI